MIINHREKIIYSLYFIICIAFILSYAITNIASVLLLVMFFVDKKSNLITKLKFIKSNKIILLFTLFFLVQLIGLSYTTNLNEGLRRITVLIPLLYLPAVVMAESKNKTYFKLFLNGLLLSIPLIFIVLILIHLYYDHRDLSTFVNFTIEEKLGVSQFYLVYIVVLPFYLAYQNIINKSYLVLNVIIFLVTLVVVLILGNKTSIILLTFLILLFSLNNLKNKKKLLFGFITISALFIVAYNIPIVKERFTNVFKTTDFDIEIIKTKNSFTITKNTLEHRALINYLSFNPIIKALPFGVGTGDVEDILQKKYEEVNFKAGILSQYNNHNQYVYEFFKTGVLGGFVFIFLLFLLNKKAASSNSLAQILTLFFTIACFVESYLFRQHGIIIFGFLIPLFLTNKLDNKNETLK